MEKDFLMEARNSLAHMRLVIQGAVCLYEIECNVLYDDARAADKEEAALAFDTLGTALYTLQTQIEELQALCAQQRRA